MPRPIRTAFAVLLLPTFEFILLRVFVRQGLGIKIGYVGMTDFDFVPPCIAAFVMLVWRMEQIEPLKLAFRARGLVYHSVTLATFLLANLFFYSLGPVRPIPYSLFWFSTGALAIGSSLFVFLNPGQFFGHPCRNLILPSLLLGWSGLLKHALTFFWVPILRATAGMSCQLYELFVPHFYCAPFVSGGEEYVHLNFPAFTLAMGTGCGGIDGLIFYLFSFLLFRLWTENAVPRLWPVYGLVGAIFIYLLNIWRVVLTSLTVWAVVSGLGWVKSTGFLLPALHSGIGWILSTAGILLFLRWVQVRGELEKTERLPLLKSAD